MAELTDDILANVPHETWVNILKFAVMNARHKRLSITNISGDTGLLKVNGFCVVVFLHIITKICNPQLRYCLNNRYGQSQLLELFALYGSIPLMEWCASLDFTDSYGSQTLYWAARGGHKHVIQWATSGKKVSEIETENDAHIATIKKRKEEAKQREFNKRKAARIYERRNQLRERRRQQNEGFDLGPGNDDGDEGEGEGDEEDEEEEGEGRRVRRRRARAWEEEEEDDDDEADAILDKEIEEELKKEDMQKNLEREKENEDHMDVDNVDQLQVEGKYAFPIESAVCVGAARGNHFDLLKWLVAVGAPKHDAVCSAAARSGNLEMLAWSYRRGFPLDDSVILSATKSGNLNVFRWAVAKDCHVVTARNSEKSLVCVAAKKGNVQLMQEILTVDAYIPSTIYVIAARYGHLHVIQWARLQSREIIQSTAASNGHLDIVQWTREIGLPLCEYSTSEAAESGHLHILQWLHSQGCPFSGRVSLLLAARGDLEALKWTKENGCSMHNLAVVFAASGGHLGTLQWLHENGCTLQAECYAKAGFHGHMHVIEWLYKQHCLMDSQLLEDSARAGNLEIFQWGLEHRCNVSDKVFQYAQDHILTWITKSKFAVQLEKSAKKEIERRAQAKN